MADGSPGTAPGGAGGGNAESGSAGASGADGQVKLTYTASVATPPSGPVRTQGKLGQALSFDGSNDYVDAGNSSVFNFGTGDFTYSAWVNLKNPPGNINTILSKDDGGGNGFLIYYFASDLRLRVFAGGTTVDCFNPLAQSTWHIITVTRRSGLVSIYQDGAFCTSSTASASVNLANNLFIGQVVSANYFSGFIDDVRIYNRALSADEIKRLYTMGRPN